MWRADKKGALIVVSFGTSHGQTREKTIGAVENALKEAYPDYEVRRAFMSKVIIRILKERDGIVVNTVEEVLEELKKEGCPQVVLQPTHIMNGRENNAMLRIIENYRNLFGKFLVGKPVLSTKEDFFQLAQAVLNEIPEKEDDHTAIVFMGHGTEHESDAIYGVLQDQMRDMGYENIYIGTVEGRLKLDIIIQQMKKTGGPGIQKVILYPLMIAAGDHAVNDMAGMHKDSWRSLLESAGYRTECRLKGLGEYEGVRQLIVHHTGDAMNDM